MEKILQKHKRLCLISAVVELLLLLTILLLILFKVENNIFQLITTIIISAIVVFNFSFEMIFNVIINIRKDAIELSSIELVESNEDKAYVFGGIGIIITGKNHYIRWVNTYIRMNFPSIIDKNIMDVFPDIKKLIETEEKGKNHTVLSSRNHNYEVELLRDANMFIFKDVTELTKLTHLNEGNTPVIGYVSIDNYEDILQSSTDDTKFSQIFYTTRMQINKYFHEKGALIRHLKDDKYMFITNKNSYKSMYEDKFHIMEEVRNNQSGFTLSIGVGYGFPEYLKLSELASSANDIAVSRGGDQAVIHPAKENFIYIGGKSELKNSRNKVKMRTYCDSFISAIENYKKILIMGHTVADFDAIGASLGVFCICQYNPSKTKRTIRIAYDPLYVEDKCRKAVELEYSREEFSSYFIDSKNVENYFDDSTLLIIVDHSSSYLSMYPSISEKAKHVIVIDHHRPDQKTMNDVIFKVIDTSASSTSELITEFIHYTQKEIKIPSRIATFMLTGISLDTRSFKKNASESTFEAASYLKLFDADSSKVDEFLKEGWEEFKQKIAILNSADSPYPGIIISENNDEEIVSDTMLAIVATEANQINEINCSFAIGRINEHQVKISARSNGSVNCQMLLEKLSGGGHFSMAACVLNELSVSQVKQKLIEILNDYLEDATVKIIKPDNKNNDEY